MNTYNDDIATHHQSHFLGDMSTEIYQGWTCFWISRQHQHLWPAREQMKHYNGNIWAIFVFNATTYSEVRLSLDVKLQTIHSCCTKQHKTNNNKKTTNKWHNLLPDIFCCISSDAYHRIKITMKQKSEFLCLKCKRQIHTNIVNCDLSPWECCGRHWLWTHPLWCRNYPKKVLWDTRKISYKPINFG